MKVFWCGQQANLVPQLLNLQLEKFILQRLHGLLPFSEAEKHQQDTDTREHIEAYREELLIALCHVDHPLKHVTFDDLHAVRLLDGLQGLKLQVAPIHVVVGVLDRNDVRAEGEDEQQQAEQRVKLVDVVCGERDLAFHCGVLKSSLIFDETCSLSCDGNTDKERDAAHCSKGRQKRRDDHRIV